MENTIEQALEYDFDHHRKRQIVGGRELNYIELGDPTKPTLLYVHGLMGTWRNWIFNLLPFSDRFHVIAVDLPGFGDSEMPAATLTIDGYVDALKELLKTLGIDRVTLIGNSMGGLIGTVFAKRASELLDRLVLVDAAGVSTASHQMKRLTRFAPLLNVVMLLSAKITQLIAFNKFISGIFLKIVLHKPKLLHGDVLLMLLLGVGKPGFLPAIRDIVKTKVADIPGEVVTPTTIIWGRDDLLIPKKDAFRFARMIPHARLEMMDDIGHIPMFEDPDRFNALIESVVAEPVPVAAQAEAA
jgi:pimeloyl-ACP methyl ester carboxylesterase